MLPGAETTCASGAGAAAAHLIAQLCLPAEASANLSRDTRVVLRPRLLERFSTPAWPAVSAGAGEVVALACAGEPAGLVLEHRLAASVVNAALGLAPPPWAGPLSRIERGVLTGVLATMAAEVSPLPRIVVGGACVPGESWREVIAVAAGRDGASGRGWLVMSDGFLTRVEWARGPGVTLPAPRIELAVTMVARDALADATVGDGVVFDEVAALPPDDAWPVVVDGGARQAPAWWRADGRLVARNETPRLDDGTTTRADGLAAVAQASTRARPAEPSARVVASCGSPVLTPVAEGGFFLARPAPVLLAVDGRAWAHGELGALGGNLVVTITRKLTA